MTTNRFIKLKFDAYHFIGEGETEPIAKKLGMRNKAVFECIASHQDMNCVSDTTIDQIVDMTGISRGTVIKAVKELEEFTYEGKPIIEKLQFYSGEKKKNLYKILPNPLVSYYNERLVEEVNSTEFEPLTDFNGTKFVLTKEQSSKELNNKELEEPSVKNERMTNKQIVSYFTGLLKDKGIDKKPNYPRLMKQMKTVEPMFNELINNDIKKVCEIVAEQYEGWGNSSQYPLEVSVIVRKWVIERALKEMKKEKEAVSQIVEQSVEATKRTQIGIDSIMSRIKKKGGSN